ncbi:MAG: ornithine cyclodeaminase family protein [Candidatus Acidiferrales bacterium]
MLDVSEMPTAIELIETAYRQKAGGRASEHKRVTVQFPPGSGYYTDCSIRINPGILPDMDSGALRIYSLYHREQVTEQHPRVLDYVMAKEVLLLYTYEGGLELAAIMADYRIMNVRTAAPTGVATRAMSNPTSRVLGVVGAGRHAPWQIAAVCAVRPIEEIRIHSRTPESRNRLVSELRSRSSLNIRAVDSAQEAVDQADVVVTVTNANRPVIDGAWLKPGAHVNVIARGEIDVETIRRAELIACSYRDQILNDSPAFLPIPEVLKDGIRSAEDFKELEEFVLNPPRAGRDRKGITLFLSQGVGLWDAAIGRWVYDQARAKNLGQELDL